MNLSIATIKLGRQLSCNHSKKEKGIASVCRSRWHDLYVRVLSGDLKTEECEGCDLGDCTELEGLSPTSHQGLITADC